MCEVVKQVAELHEDSTNEERKRLARMRAGKARATTAYLPTERADSSDEEPA